MKKLTKRTIDRTVHGPAAETDWRGKREHLHQEFGYALRELLETVEGLRVREYRIYLEALAEEK